MVRALHRVSDINNPVLPDYVDVGVQQADGTWKPTGNIFEGDPLIGIAQAHANTSFATGPIVQVVRANKSGTDWYKEMTRVAPVSRYSLGMSGGGDRAHYYANLAYYNQQGIAINQYLKRYNLRFNSEFKPFEKLRIGENLQLSYRENPTIGDQQSENQLNMAYRMPTIIPVHTKQAIGPEQHRRDLTIQLILLQVLIVLAVTTTIKTLQTHLVMLMLSWI